MPQNIVSPDKKRQFGHRQLNVTDNFCVAQQSHCRPSAIGRSCLTTGNTSWGCASVATPAFQQEVTTSCFLGPKTFTEATINKQFQFLDSAEYFPGVAVCTALQNTKLGIQCPDVEEATAFTLSPIDRHFTDFCELQVNKTCIIQLFFPALC